MKKLVMASIALTVVECSANAEQSKLIGRANPASEYCVKQGGKLEIVKNREGEVGYCNLPSGERIEEWTLFRRDNSHETAQR